MEFPEAGKNCNWHLCNALDFLPITCTYCDLVFCKDHFNADAHACSMFKKSDVSESSISVFTCFMKDCKNTSPVEMLCPKCQKHFCVSHRHHDCFDVSPEDIAKAIEVKELVKQQYNDSLNAVNTIVTEAITKAKQGNSKKRTTALQIQLMRLKGKACGPSGLPISERIYFLIYLPKRFQKAEKAVYVSKEWSIGRCLDCIAETCKVPNKNNEAMAEKLRLFKRSDGTQLVLDLSTKLKDVICSGTVENGETLILEYISHDEDLSEYVLNNLNEYMN